MSGEQSRDPWRWLAYAADDLRAARHVDLLNRHRCFLAQQAAEKAIKAALVASEVEFPWLHNLNALRELLPANWSHLRALGPLGELTVWAAVSRYPMELGDPTDSQTSAAVAQAERAVDAARADLSAHGIDAGDE